ERPKEWEQGQAKKPAQKQRVEKKTSFYRNRRSQAEPDIASYLAHRFLDHKQYLNCNSPPDSGSWFADCLKDLRSPNSSALAHPDSSFFQVSGPRANQSSFHDQRAK